MGQAMFPIQLRKRYTTGLVEGIQAWFKRERSVDYPSTAIESALETWLERQYDGLMESLPELLTSPHLAEAQEFQRILEQEYADSKLAGAVEHVPVHAQLNPVFSGGRAFSKEKLGAMMAYIASKGHDIYRTNLNKLLFYSDMTAYYLRGQGISGALYLNMPYGPVPEGVDEVANELASTGVISRMSAPEFGSAAQRIVKGEQPAPDLTPDEIATVDWVLSTYGNMSASEISEYSHKEKAYKFTRPLEPIAYEYAKFFQKLPERAD